MGKDKFYAGIGSRETPENFLRCFQKIGQEMAKQGYVLRSGGAEGADAAFELGCTSVNGRKEIYLPWPRFNGSKSTLHHVCGRAQAMAEKLHPAWERCSDGARKLLSRNIYQVLGVNLNTPVELVICWTDHPLGSGGTALPMRLARERSIPIYNFSEPGDVAKFCEKYFEVDVPKRNYECDF